MSRLMVLLLCSLLISCQSLAPGEQQVKQDREQPSALEQQPSEQENPPLGKEQVSDKKNKKVVVLMVDSMTSALVDAVVEKGTMPALHYLIENGTYKKDMVVPFPSMSVTVESGLLTGRDPEAHQIPGLAWYDEEEDRIINYGSSIFTAIKSGLVKVAEDTLYKLNQVHLNREVETIHDQLHKMNKTSGSINMLMYRGPYIHQAQFPEAIARLLALPDRFEITGPRYLALGHLVKPWFVKDEPVADGYTEKLGLNDQFSMEVFQQMVKHDEQPDLLYIFLPDFDLIAHEHGPHYRKGLERVDQYLQGILNAYGSWEKALESSTFIILGDHGQDKIIEDKQQASILLDDTYKGFRMAALGEAASAGDIAFATNQRMSYVYDLRPQADLSQLADLTLADKRIAVVAYEQGDWIHVLSPDHHGSFRFQKGDSWQDSYSQGWEIEGNEKVLALKLDIKGKQISFTQYPDALNQLYGAFKSHTSKKLILNAKPGYSFKSEGIPVHEDGGDHGGLHRNDTLAALIVTGDYPHVPLRVTDVPGFVLYLLTSPETSRAKPVPVKAEDIHVLVKDQVKEMDGIKQVVAVSSEDDIFVAVQVSRFKRLQLKALKAEMNKSLKMSWPDYQVHLSTDWKIFNELKKLEENGHLSLTEMEKQFQKIEKLMKD